MNIVKFDNNSLTCDFKQKYTDVSNESSYPTVSENANTRQPVTQF